MGWQIRRLEAVKHFTTISYIDSATVTITAADPDGLQANQGFNVTVEAESTNQPPVAVGTIPGSRLQIGGTSTIDVAGYFSDPDGDELSYAGASSNGSVATVAMEGSSAMISALAAGDAVITITASDESASVSQGFRIDVPEGPEEATVVITRLLDADRNAITDPTGISGTIYALLDVQSNDETWTAVGLTLNGETVTPLCRGTGGSSADAVPGPGLAAAGQVEIECRLQTDAVLGECVGMPLMPKYANGEYELNAFLTTDDDATREAVAGQPIALKNSNFVTIAHVPGNRSEVGTHTQGLTFYGGPSTAEGNVNTFHACPVAYDGAEVGTMQLGSKVVDGEGDEVAGVNRVTFRNPAGGSYYPVIEAPFTWTISTAHSRTGNYLVENVAGETATVIVNDGIITDPNGRDITASFRKGGMAQTDPIHFDFKAPAISASSEVVIATSNDPTHSSWGSTTASYYRASGGSSARRFRITGMSDMGVGVVYGTTSAIAVGDWSVGRNSDSNANTAFTPLDGLENVTLVSQLPEEDPEVDGIADGGGADAYVAELQSLADRLGNSTWLGGGRIRTASTFGVDNTPPVISRMRPAEALVLKTDELSFEIEDPELGTGEDGSQPRATVHAYAGDSRYWVTSRHYWTADPAPPTAGGSVTVDITPAAGSRFAREESHTVYVRALDVAGNETSTSFTFTRDQTPPALTLSAVPSSFGSTTAKSVSVTVAGTLSDATEMRRVFLSIHAGDTCTATSATLESSQVSGPVRRLDNDSNEIEFSEVFTVKQGDDAGVTSYCFFLKAEDDARDADNRADANVYSAQVSTFSVQWPGTAPVGPVATQAAIPAASLMSGGTAMVNAADHFTDANGDALTYTAISSDNAVATVSVTDSLVTVTAVAAGTATITITASDGGTGTDEKEWTVNVAAGPTFEFFAVNATDGTIGTDATESVDLLEGTSATYAVKLTEGDSATVKVTPSSGATVSRETLTFPHSDGTSDTLHVTVTATHDRDVTTEDDITVTLSADDFDPAVLEVTSEDDDVALTVRESSITEGGDAETFHVVAELTTARATGTDVTVTWEFGGGTAAGGDFDATGVAAITISGGDMSDSVEVTLTGTDDVEIEGSETVHAQATAASDAPYIAPDMVTIMDDDPNVTLMVNGASSASLNEGDDATTLTISAESTVAMPAPFDVVVTVPAPPGGTEYELNGGTAAVTVTLTIDTGNTDSNSQTVSLDPLEDTDTNDVSIEITGPAAGQQIGGAGKTYSIKSAMVTIEDNDES